MSTLVRIYQTWPTNGKERDIKKSVEERILREEEENEKGDGEEEEEEKEKEEKWRKMVDAGYDNGGYGCASLGSLF
ncbi:hypothetical protein HZH66_004701 [Vespula vulgaris]|uniref:Uncharacterized protein n=1 Tax=Vespula vulgaris TaxID=7454 RepID=A0A834KCQ2_VESVU|nr:hypothetical protein HZH66_004701 [Vespula vulgaris]